MCCSVLQCADALCHSVLRCVAVWCSVLQCVAVCCSVLQCAAVCCSVLQCAAVCCRMLQCVAVWCSVLQCVAVRLDFIFCDIIHEFYMYHIIHTKNNPNKKRRCESYHSSVNLYIHIYIRPTKETYIREKRPAKETYTNVSFHSNENLHVSYHLHADLYIIHPSYANTDLCNSLLHFVAVCCSLLQT